MKNIIIFLIRLSILSLKIFASYYIYYIKYIFGCLFYRCELSNYLYTTERAIYILRKMENVLIRSTNLIDYNDKSNKMQILITNMNKLETECNILDNEIKERLSFLI